MLLLGRRSKDAHCGLSRSAAFGAFIPNTLRKTAFPVPSDYEKKQVQPISRNHDLYGRFHCIISSLQCSRNRKLAPYFNHNRTGSRVV